MEGLPAITSRPPASRPPRTSTQEEQALPPGLFSPSTPPTEPENLRPVRLEEHTDVEADAPSTPPLSAEASGLLDFSPPSVSGAPRRPVWPLVVLVASAGMLLGAALALGMSADGDTPLATAGPRPTRAATTLPIPAGTFSQGLDEQTRSLILQACFKVADDPDAECDQDILLAGEWPQEHVTLPAFSIDAGEVTQAAYGRCVSQKKCTPAQIKGCRVYTVQGYQIALRVPKALIHPELPAICVTHAQAAGYCSWAGGALPSHQQWERAARGAKDAPLFPWGDTWDPQIANWGERDVLKTAVPGRIDGSPWSAPSGAYPASDTEEGVRDMAGNVAEWVLDQGRETVGVRGGSWTSWPFDLRVTKRAPVPPTQARTDVGFRCAYTP